MSIFKQSKNGTAKTAKTAKAKVVATETNGADKVTHVALGAPVAIADAVNETVERFTDPAQRGKDLKAFREQIERGIESAEKRGVEIRKQLPGRVEQSIKLVEKRSGELTQQLVDQAKVARARVEPTVRRIEPTVRRIETEARQRGRKLSDTTQGQLRSAQERVRELV